MATLERPGLPPLIDPLETQLWLAARGIRSGQLPVPALADDDATVLRTHAGWLAEQVGVQATDVLRIHPDMPNLRELREQFAREHTHDDDELRLFLAGSGLFWFNPGGPETTPFAVRCGAGDWVAVPRGTPHWFDMGDPPCYTVLRVFASPAGWAPVYTGSGAEARFTVSPSGCSR